MREPSKKVVFLWTLFQQLRRRQFMVGLDDYLSLQQALRLGFGLSSRKTLRELCCALWAKSRREQEILTVLFDQLDQHKLPDWTLPEQEIASSDVPSFQAKTEQEHQPLSVIS